MQYIYEYTYIPFTSQPSDLVHILVKQFLVANISFDTVQFLTLHDTIIL